MKDPAQYAQACALFDLESCIDYYATEIYIANHDWPQTNYSVWRTRQKGGGACGDGKWRWILFDVNMAMALGETQADTIAKAKKYDRVFRHLMKNTEFANALTDKLVELADNTFNPARVEARIREYEAFMANAIENEYARYYNNTKSEEDFIAKCENKIRFFYERNAYIKEMYGDGRVV